MNTILVTGASGFLGEALARKLASAGRIVRSGFQHSERPSDLREPDAVRRLLDSARPDVVVHTAAYRDPDFCETHPDEARRLNVEPVRVMTSELPADSRFVLISTDYVFDGEMPPYREDSDRRPLSVYGCSKAEAEDLALARHNTLVVRIPLLIGIEPAHRGPSGFVLQIARHILQRQPVEVDDVLVRYPTWTEDVADAIAFLLARNAAGVFHVSSPRGGTRYHWTLETARILDRQANHVSPMKKPFPRPAPRPPNAQLATPKLRALGFDQFTDFTAAAKQVLEGLMR